MPCCLDIAIVYNVLMSGSMGSPTLILINFLLMNIQVSRAFHINCGISLSVQGILLGFLWN